MTVEIESEDFFNVTEEKPDQDSEKLLMIQDILEAIPKYDARCIVLKIVTFIIGWSTSSTNVFLVMNSIFHSQLPDNYDTIMFPYIAVLLFVSLSEVVGFFHGLLLVYGSDVSSPQLIRDSMILAVIAIASNWLSILTIFLSGLPLEMATQPLIMTAFTFIALIISNSYYFVLRRLEEP